MDNVDFNRLFWGVIERSRYQQFVKTSRKRRVSSALEELLEQSKEYGRQSFVVPTQESPEHQEIETLHRPLCPRCARINFTNVDLSNSWSSVCLGSFSEIVMDAACPTCKLFSCLIAKYA